MFCLRAFVSCALIAGLLGIVASTAVADEQGNRGDREALIKKFDKNGDGKLDDQEKETAKKEFQGKRGAGTPGDRRELMKKYDKNGDGKLDEAEREAAQKELRGAGKPGDRKPGNLESNPKLLKHFDKNGDGKLDDGERAAAKAEMEKRRANKSK